MKPGGVKRELLEINGRFCGITFGHSRAEHDGGIQGLCDSLGVSRSPADPRPWQITKHIARGVCFIDKQKGCALLYGECLSWSSKVRTFKDALRIAVGSTYYRPQSEQDGIQIS
jgi:hypothetical protein